MSISFYIFALFRQNLWFLNKTIVCSFKKNAVVKCDADYAIELRDKYNGILPAWHWNKKYWNELHFDTDVSDELIKQLIDHSLAEVLKKLPRKTQNEYASFSQSSVTTL